MDSAGDEIIDFVGVTDWISDNLIVQRKGPERILNSSSAMS
jgi:hypothetical protein